VRVLEALRILEEATIDCKTRSIDTPEVRDALDVIAPYCKPKWKVEGFRNCLKPSLRQHGLDLEGQQQNLRVYFRGIYGNMRGLLCMQIGELNYRYKRTKDAAVKAELDRLTAELEKLPERWEYRAPKVLS